MSEAIIGINPTEITAATSPAAFRPGTRGGYDHPTLGYQEFVYGRANGAITGLGYACVERTGFQFSQANVTLTTPGTAGPGTRVGIAQAPLSTGQWGWFQVYGKGSLRTLASAAIGTRLNTTATDGALDDDGTTGSEQVFGIVLNTATGGAAATNPDAILSYPVVGITLP